MSQSNANSDSNQNKSHWYKDNEDTRTEVASYWEAFFVFAVFAFVLIILYPKNMLKEQILAEKSNYELTSIYLKNMLKLEPENADLMAAMAKVSVKRGNVDLALELLNLLKNHKERRIQIEVNQIRFNLLEVQRNFENKKALILVYDAQIKALINKIADEGLFKDEEVLNWYNSALQYSQKDAAMKFLQRISRSGKDAYVLEQCVYLADALHDTSKKMQCLEKLAMTSSVQDSKKWLLALYQMYLKEGENNKAKEVLEKLANIDPHYKEVLAGYQLRTGNYKGSAKIYMTLYDLTPEKKDKVKYLFRALEVLQVGKQNDEAVKLAKRYEDQYLDNQEVTEKLIRFYLAIEHVEEARELSVKWFKSMEKR